MAKDDLYCSEERRHEKLAISKCFNSQQVSCALMLQLFPFYSTAIKSFFAVFFIRAQEKCTRDDDNGPWTPALSQRKKFVSVAILREKEHWNVPLM